MDGEGSRARESSQRRAVYALLSRAFLHEPDAESVRWFRSLEVQAILGELGLSLGRGFGEKDERVLVEELAREYSRLFLVPPTHLPPVESFYVGGVNDPPESFEPFLQGRAAVEVEDFYRRAGLILPDKAGQLPDHIGLELEALGLLCELESEAAAAGGESRFQRCRDLARQFLTEHPIRWIPDFCRAILQKTESPFYRVLAEMTRSFLESEVDALIPCEATAEDGIQ